MKGFIRFFLNQAVLLNLVFVLLMVVGAFCAFDLPVERYPDVNMGKVVISAFLPGASPEEVEALVTREIEDALDDLENVEYISSKSYRQRASVIVKFLDGSDYRKGYDDIRFKVLGIQNDLPKEMDPPRFTEIRVSEWLPAVTVNLAGERGNRSLSLIAEELKIPLRRIPGVKEVALDGEYEREFHVYLDPDKLTRRKVVFEDVARALSGANVSIPAGDFTSKAGDYVVVVDERFRTRDDVGNAIIRRDLDGSFVRVRDVMSDAMVSYRDPYVIASINGQDSVALKVVKDASGNALDIVAAVEDILSANKPLLDREGVRAVLTQDQRVYVEDSLNTLGANMAFGIALVMGIIWLVMGFRNAMLASVGIPFAFLTTMVIMWLTGNSLNQITLFSFVLVSGIIVDDAIVVVENIHRHAQLGKSLTEAAVEGTAEVAMPVVAATLTTVAAFLPMLIMTGSTGEFFALVPKAVTYALLASLIECLIFLPPHFVDWPGAKRLRESGDHAKERRFMLWLQKAADRLLVLVMRRRLIAVGAVFMAFVCAMVMLGLSVSGKANLIRIKFFPDDYNTYYIEVMGPPSEPIESTSARLKEISAFIESLGPGMTKSATGYAGFYFNEDYETLFGSNVGHVVAELPVKEDRAFADAPGNDPARHLEAMREKLKRFEGGGWTIRLRPLSDGPPAGKDVNIRTLGTDQKAVAALSALVLDYLKTDPVIAPNLVNLSNELGSANRIFRIIPKNGRDAEYGLTPAQVAALAGSVLDGRLSGTFRLDDEDVDLRLKINPEFMRDPEQALDVPALEKESGPVRLSDLCDLDVYMEPGQRNRFQGQRAISVTANLRPDTDIAATGVVERVRAWYAGVRDRHPGAALNFAGEFESTRKSFASLASAFVIAVLAIYLILGAQFKSYIQPAIILSAVVFSLTGVVFGAFFTRTIFTVNSFIATVGVTGVVVNDSLVLLDFINRLYASGLDRLSCAREAVRIRLRPILLTTLTTTLGLLPMALGIPSYSLVWGGMAATFVTGLCTATALTIFIVPVLWDVLAGRKERRLEREKALAGR